jgi:hypothetical protein
MLPGKLLHDPCAGLDFLELSNAMGQALGIRISSVDDIYSPVRRSRQETRALQRYKRIVPDIWAGWKNVKLDMRHKPAGVEDIVSAATHAAVREGAEKSCQEQPGAETSLKTAELSRENAVDFVY